MKAELEDLDEEASLIDAMVLQADMPLTLRRPPPSASPFHPLSHWLSSFRSLLGLSNKEGGSRFVEGRATTNTSSELRQRHQPPLTLENKTDKMGSENGRQPGEILVKVCPQGMVQPEPIELDDKETFFTIIYQVIVPFLIAGFAMVGAGIYLQMLQTWPVFKNVPEIMILVPALLGLKGNLEMTLASRLSTEANLGTMNNRKEQRSMIFGNLVLVQCQATVIGLLSSLVAVISDGIIQQKFNWGHAIMLCACSIITASIASLVLGIVTTAIIILSLMMKINPDNVTTPIAASLGDITSLVLLSWVASFLYGIMNSHNWISIVIICIFIGLMPLWIYIAKNNKYTDHVLLHGWTPIISAMLISTLGGLALEEFVKVYKGLSAFQPVINGVGGNLVSIQASRLSTALHKQSEPGQLPPDTDIFVSPVKIFFSNAPHALTSRVLISLVVPGHLAFVYAITYFQSTESQFTPLFVCTYLAAALLQVAILLHCAYTLTHLFWKRGVNPDNTTIPYLTALGDLLGIIFLGFTYKIVELGEHI